MTPLDAAQAIIDARARATQGEWYSGRCSSHFYAPHISTDEYAAYIPKLEDAEFIALSANHAAAVAQAYKDAIKERDYWRTIAQEGVGGLPLENKNEQ